MTNQIDLFRGFPSELGELFGASRRLNRFFDDFFTGMPSLSQPMNEFSNKCELEELDDHYVLCIEIPGIPKENIHVEARGNSLHISGERRSEVKVRKGQPGRREFGSYEQSLTLPLGADSSKVEAEYKDGILYLVIPKGESQKTRKIEIGSGGEGLLAKIKGKIAGEIGGKSTRGEKEKAA